MPEAGKVQDVPEDQKPKEGEKRASFLKVDRSLRPEGFHIEGSGADQK